MKVLRIVLACLAAMTMVLFNVGAAEAAPASPAANPCPGGVLPTGTHQHGLVITGDCTIPPGASVTVHGNLALAPGALLKAAPGATVHVTGDVLVAPGALFALFGCVGADHEPVSACGQVVDGSVFAFQPLTVKLLGATVHGNFISLGGGQPVTGPNPGGCEESTDPQPLNFPIKDNVIDGHVLIAGWQGCWLGYIRNQQHGTAAFVANHTASVDSTEIVTNQIQGSLACFANSPAPRIGDSEGQPNDVAGFTLGQCAHLVPAPSTR